MQETNFDLWALGKKSLGRFGFASSASVRVSILSFLVNSQLLLGDNRGKPELRIDKSASF